MEAGRLPGREDAEKEILQSTRKYSEIVLSRRMALQRGLFC
jgi:hypothetical protein